MKKKIIFTVIGLLAASVVYAASVTCAFDNLIMLTTGQMRTEANGIFFEYRCANGHTAWVKQ